MRRGEIYLVDFDPSQGAEVRGARPAIVVSNEGANRAAARSSWGVINVVPMTSNVSRDVKFNAIIAAAESGLDCDSRAQAEQVRSVSLGRIGPLIGELSAAALRAVDEALRVQLSL